MDNPLIAWLKRRERKLMSTKRIGKRVYVLRKDKIVATVDLQQELGLSDEETAKLVEHLDEKGITHPQVS